MTNRLVVLRGLPGSGKSTYVSKNFSGHELAVCSADQYFMLEGQYHFNPSKLPNAHAFCFKAAIAACTDLVGVVVIDNTSLTTWEVSPYASLAAAYGYTFEVITLTCTPEVSAARNVHGVTRATIDRMAATLETEKLLPWWQHTII